MPPAPALLLASLAVTAPLTAMSLACEVVERTDAGQVRQVRSGRSGHVRQGSQAIRLASASMVGLSDLLPWFSPSPQSVDSI